MHKTVLVLAAIVILFGSIVASQAEEKQNTGGPEGGGVPGQPTTAPKQPTTTAPKQPTTTAPKQPTTTAPKQSTTDVPKLCSCPTTAQAQANCTAPLQAECQIYCDQPTVPAGYAFDPTKGVCTSTPFQEGWPNIPANCPAWPAQFQSCSTAPCVCGLK